MIYQSAAKQLIAKIRSEKAYIDWEQRVQKVDFLQCMHRLHAIAVAKQLCEHVPIGCKVGSFAHLNVVLLGVAHALTVTHIELQGISNGYHSRDQRGGHSAFVAENSIKIFLRRIRMIDVRAWLIHQSAYALCRQEFLHLVPYLKHRCNIKMLCLHQPPGKRKSLMRI